VSELELKKFILSELAKLELNGIKVIDFSMGLSSTKFEVAFEQSTVEFVLNDDDQFQILSVVYNGKKYVDADYLCHFNDFIIDVITTLKPVIKEKKAEYMKNPDLIDYREEQAKLKEEHLEKRAFELQAREQVLIFQTQALEMESQLLEDEKVRNDAQKVRKWTRENNFLFKWLSVASAVVLVVLVLIFI